MKDDEQQLREEYLRLSNTPANCWTDKSIGELIELCRRDDRVLVIEYVRGCEHIRNHEVIPEAFIKTDEFQGVFTLNTIASRLHESQSEREARLAQNRWKNAVLERIRVIESRYFTHGSTTVNEALSTVNKLKSEVPEVKDNVCWWDTLGLNRLESDLKDIIKFEKAMKDAAVTHRDISRAIRVISSGKIISDKEEARIDKTIEFVNDYFKQSYHTFSWSEYLNMYRIKW